MQTYDVFLSHSSRDKPAVEELARALQDEGLKPFLDKWHLVPGEPWQEALEDALDQSSTCAVFLGPDGIGPWQNEEMRSALDERVQDSDFRVIPVLLDGAPNPERDQLPRFLRRLTWVDFRSGTRAHNLHRLIAGIRGIAPGDGEPPDGSSMVWTVPYHRNPYFQGRDDVLDSLRESLTRDGSAAVGQAISGLGGIGKTQTALEYAWRHRDDYRAVLWVRAETREELRSNWVDLARRLDLEEQHAKDDEVAVAAVLAWLENEDGWLLVFDNADDPDLLLPYLPPSRRGHVLVTSRASRGHLVSRLRLDAPLELEVLEPDAARDFLLKRTRRTEANAKQRRETERLAEELGYLPLALEQAAAYLLETSVSFARYRKAFAKRRSQLLKDGQPVDYHATVSTTWTISVQKVADENPASRDLLTFCAFLSPDAIPFELFIDGSRELGEPLAKALDGATEDPALAAELIAPLVRYSLLRHEVGSDTVGVHRLLQAVIIDAMPPEERREWVERSARAVDAAFPWPKFETWPKCRRLQPHALTALAHAKQQAIEGSEVAGLAASLASFARRRAAFREAETLYERSLEIYERVHGDEHSSVAAALNGLGILYVDQGRYEEAEPLYQRSLSIKEKALGEDHPEVAQTLNNLGLLYVDQGRYVEAEPLYQRSLAITEKAHGEDHPSVASTLNNLGVLYKNQGRYAEAEPLHQRDLAITEKALGEDHPSVAQTLNNLGLLYFEQGRYAEAEPQYQRSLAIMEKALGEDHPSVAQTLNNLGLLYVDQGRYEDAEPLYQRSLAIYEKAFGAEHPEIARTLNNYANLLERMDEDDDQGTTSRKPEILEMRRRAQAIRDAKR